MTSPHPASDPSYHRVGGADRADSSEPERFERAGAISDRLVDNIETVVYGKRDEIKLVLTALACDGHVLLEDVPGTAKTVLARAIAGSIDGAIPQRIQCTPDLQPTDVTGLSVFDQRTSGLRVPARADLRQRRPRRRDQPRDAEDAVRASRGDGGAPGHRRRRHARAALSVPPPRDREPDRVRRDLPAAGGAARPLLPPHGARISGARGRAEASSPISATCIRSTSFAPVVGLDEVHELRAAAQHVYVDASLHRWVVELVRATREQESVVIGSSVRGSLALERAARAWALLDGRSYVVPEDIERLFSPVLVHRVVFTPGVRRPCPCDRLGRRRSRSFAELPRARAADRVRRRIRSSRAGSGQPDPAP